MARFPDVGAVYFDAVGTLIHPDPPAARVYADIGRRFGTRLTPEVIATRFTAAFVREEEIDRAAGWRTDEAREVLRWQAVVAAVLDDVTDPVGCFAALYEHFARPRSWRVEPGGAAALGELGRRGLTVGVASNFDRRLRPVLAGLPGLGDLRSVMVSSEVGWRKPAPEFFSAAAASVGLPTERVLFVGDDLTNDYAGALAAGCAALLFDPRGAAPAMARVAALTDVPGLLTRGT